MITQFLMRRKNKLILYYIILLLFFPAVFTFSFDFACLLCHRSKDSGAYDLGELDQAFFMYLDGQADPSTVQDQRRELCLSLSLSNTYIYRKKLKFFLLPTIFFKFRNGKTLYLAFHFSLGESVRDMGLFVSQ